MMDKALLYKILANNTGAEVSASGNPATLSGTLEDKPLKDCKIYGWSKQESTTGANLWYKGDIEGEQNVGVRINIPAGDYCITADIESTDTDDDSILILFYYGETVAESKGMILKVGKKSSGKISFEKDIIKAIFYASTNNNQAVGDIVTIKNIMINAGRSPLPYEPYTGGQPSPNPDYPQEIVSAGMKWSTGAQLYDMDTRLNVEGTEYEKEGTTYIVNIVKASGNLLYGIPFQFSEEDVDATVSVSGFFNLTSVCARIDLLDLEGNIAGTLKADGTEKKLSAKCSKIRLNWSSGGKFKLTDFMLNLGSVALPYEPYTGGIPKLYGDKIGLEVHGKNLFDYEYASKQENWVAIPGKYYYIPYYVGKGSTVTVSYDEKPERNLNAYVLIGSRPGETSARYAWLYHSTSQTLISNTETFVAKTDYIYVNAAGDYLKMFRRYFKNFQIEVSPSPTAFEPYHTPQSLSISTPTGLPAIPVDSGGNYTDVDGQQWIADCIDLKRGKYVQWVWKGEFNGNESWGTYISSGYYLANILPEKMSNREMLCNQLRRSDGEIASDVIIVGAFNANNSLYIENCTLRDNTLADKGLSNWKAHLAEHPLVVMTYLNEPIERDLTQAEIQAYQNLATYAGTTILENDADCYMEVSAGGGDALRAKKIAFIFGK